MVKLDYFPQSKGFCSKATHRATGEPPASLQGNCSTQGAAHTQPGLRNKHPVISWSDKSTQRGLLSPSTFTRRSRAGSVTLVK